MKKAISLIMICLIAVSMFSILAPQVKAEIGWWTTKTSLPQPQALFGAAVVKGKIYAIGGQYQGGDPTPAWSDANYEYDPVSDSWTSKASMPTKRTTLTAVSANDRIYAIGGAASTSGGAYSTNEEYDPVSNSWTLKAPMPTPRNWISGAAVNGKVYVIGGSDNSGGIFSMNEVYDPLADTWTTKSPDPQARLAYGIGVVGGKIYVIGGWVRPGAPPGEPTTLNEEYDPQTDTWTTKAPMPTARNGLAVAVVNNRIYAIGGATDFDPWTNNLNVVEEYDPFSDTWRTVQSMPTARSLLSAAAVGNNIYAIGGWGSSGYLDTNEEFNIQTVEASGTIYIRADGSIDPPDAPISTVDNVTYTLTGNITSDADGIVVERSNITIDGDGYTLQGTGVDESKGIYLFGIDNVTIKNANIKWFYDGVCLHHSSFISLFGNNITLGKGSWHCAVLLVSSSNNKISRNNIISPWTHGVRLESSCDNNISENNVTNTSLGIQLTSSSNNNTIYGNYVTNNEYAGILLSLSSNNTIFGNAINNSKYNFGVEGAFLSHFKHSIDTSNLVNGKPIYYLVNKNNLVINLTTYQDIGYLALVNCTNVTVKDLNLTNNAQGLLLVNTNNSNIINSSITNNYNGIQLFSSSHNNISKSNVIDNVNGIVLQMSSNYNNISGNIITENSWGVYFRSSSYGNIFGNKIEANTNGGILFEYSSDNSITENTIAENNGGILLSRQSSRNNVTGNDIVNNAWGILLDYWSSSNIIYENTIANNGYGVFFVGYGTPSNNNKFYHNNFIGNTKQIELRDIPPSVNVWDDGYPSGGNYWSDHNPPDIYSGPYQNETGSDGIGDEAYVIDEDNTDRYPLIYPYGYVPSPDLNGDGTVNILDVIVLAGAFGSEPDDPNWNPDADLNGDGIVNILDAIKLAGNFRKTI